jgi:hypothetical protein
MSSRLSRRQALTLAGAATAGGALLGALPATPAAADTIVPTTLTPTDPEPNVNLAKHWWPAARQVWTPLGWKGHLFRFNAFYDGTMICEPGAVLAGPKPDIVHDGPKPNVVPYQGKNFQVTVVMPNRDGSFDAFPTTDHEMWSDDLGLRQQGWTQQNETPLLWTEFRRQEGFVLTESAFVHVKGGQEVQTAIEPIYVRMRFTITHVDPRLLTPNFTFLLRLSKAYLKPAGVFNQQDGVPVWVRPEDAPLDRPLWINRIYNPGGDPMTVPVYDTTNNVRLIMALPAKSSISFAPNATTNGVYDVQVGMPVTMGNFIELMVPMLTEPVDEATREFNLGWDGALAECEAFWKPKANTVANIQTPEPYVNEFFRRSPQLAQIVAEKSTDTGLWTFLSGSYAYDVLWSTPTSMVSHMFMDLLGYHDVVEQHIQIYKQFQGTRVPPSSSFNGTLYPGYLCTPASLQAIDWMSDHGAILELISVHALLTNSAEFISGWLDVIVKACEFIEQACAITGHRGVQGLLPPGFATDEEIETQGIISQAFTYRGLHSAVMLLTRLGHPRAAEFAAFADNFKNIYVTALRALAANSPTWTDANGKKHPIIPATFTGEQGSFGDLTMLDTGALMSVYAGLLPASDDLMTSYVDYFRNGPNTLIYDAAHHNALDRPILDHEQSSSEPCYSWNMFHNWQLGDRRHYLEGLYGLIVGGISQDTYISCEHRNAIYGNLFCQPLIVWSARHAVIDDEIAPNELHLLRLCPLAWLSSSSPTKFDNVPTRFGPVSLEFRLSRDGRGLDVDFSARFHHPPARVILHRPPVPGLHGMSVNGRDTGNAAQFTI